MKRSLFVSVSMLALGSAAHAAVFTNGSFELGTDPGATFLTVAGGDSTTITGWTVGPASIDYIGGLWTASSGSRSVDLSGDAAGSLAQTFDTVAGTTYSVKFDLAGNPQGAPTVKTVQVTAAAASANYTFDTTGKTLSAMGWVNKTFTFTATSASSTLKFQSLDNTSYGPALDNVTIQAVPEPASFGALAVGGLALLRRRRK